MKNLVFYLLILSSFQSLAQGRTNITVGEQIDGLIIENVQHFKKNQITTNDLLGKWTILDFWTTGCTACVKSFPKINDLQKKFSQIQFILITNDGKRYPGVRKIYDKFRKNMGLELASAFDSVLFKKFNIQSVPFIIVLDPHGKVHSTPVSTDITEENLMKLINNPTYAFTTMRNEEKKMWKHWINPNELDSGHTALQSILVRNDNEWSSGNVQLDSDTLMGVYQVTNVLAKKLYMIATNWYKFASPFKNQYWPSPVLETRNLNDPVKEKLGDDVSYNYSLTMPKDLSSGNSIRKRLAVDLDSYFGTYVVIEDREMPYWALTALPGAKMRLSNEENKFDWKAGPTGLNAKGDMGFITSFLYQYVGKDLPIVDETNIKDQIHFKFEAVMTDIGDVQKALKKEGLLLQQKTKLMKVLVIKSTSGPEILTSKSSSNGK